jgi:hypothetical protein
MIDRGDLDARDLWACVVHAIHEQQEGIVTGRARGPISSKASSQAGMPAQRFVEPSAA